jgi:hypothetical protein
MRASSLFPAILILLSGVFFSCHSAIKLTESGDYDGAIDLCIRNLRGKSSKKLKYVQALELAFSKAQERDTDAIASLKSGDRGETWIRINEIHQDIRRRQDKIKPLLPLRAETGYQAKFSLMDIGSMENESRIKAADYLYSRAEALVEKGEKGNKLAAREACDVLNDLSRRYYRGEYREKDALMKRARELGTSYVLVELKNQSGRPLGETFRDRLLSVPPRDLDTEWREFYFDSREGDYFDYRINITIKSVDVSPERVNERNYEDEKRVEDGWEYVLDQRGNVLKDSLGNDVKRTKYTVVKAQVKEVQQTKATRLTARATVTDEHTGSILDSHDMGTEILFENYAATFRGDERALSKESRSRIGNAPVPFPRDADMLIQAADRMKPDLVNWLRCCKGIL